MLEQRNLIKKLLMNAQKLLNQQQGKNVEREQEVEIHTNFPNDYVSLAFLVYNGNRDVLSEEQVKELKSCMYQKIGDYFKSNCMYNTYCCCYTSSKLWDYDGKEGTFRRKSNVTTLDFARDVADKFVLEQLETVLPNEMVQQILSMKSEEVFKDASFKK